jgi:hypothetical protein
MKASFRNLCVSVVHSCRICRAKAARFGDPLARLGLPTDCRETILAITQEAPSHAKCLSEVASQDFRFGRESLLFLGKPWFGGWSLVCKHDCRSRSSRDGRPKSTGDQPCRFGMCFPANRTPATWLALGAAVSRWNFKCNLGVKETGSLSGSGRTRDCHFCSRYSRDPTLS